MVLLTSYHSCLQGFQRVSDNIGNDAPATRDRFEAIVKACAKSASLDSSFQESEIAAANGHSSSCPEARVRTAARTAYSMCMACRPITVQALPTFCFLNIHIGLCTHSTEGLPLCMLTQKMQEKSEKGVTACCTFKKSSVNREEHIWGVCEGDWCR